MVVELVVALLIVSWIIWSSRTNGSLREMNAGARLYREKRYTEAEAHFRQLLTKRLPPGVEADTRRRLADTLDILGRSGEAAAERECVKAIIAQNPRDAKAQQARGDLLKRKHQYDEACEAYTQALEKTPSQNRSERALIMAKLAYANYEAGRPADTVIWAEISLASLPNPVVRRSMERMAGIGYSDQGDLEKAEYHYRRSLELAELHNDPEEISKDLGILAGIHQKRGRFEEAIAACQQARQVFAGPAQTSYLIEAECLCEMGHFNESRTVMAQCRNIPVYDQPQLRRRLQAIAALCCARIEIRAEQPKAALAFLDQARPGFEAEPEASTHWPPSPQKGDDKLLLWCDAVKTLALAQNGEIALSRSMHDSVLSRLPLFFEDRGTKLGVYKNLGRMAFVLGDLAESKELLGCYLECQPYPNDLLSAHYWLGETHLRLGETDAARDFFRQAVAPGIDSLDARLAQARLNELGG